MRSAGALGTVVEKCSVLHFSTKVDGPRESEERSKSAVSPSGLFFPAAYLARWTRKGASI